MTSSFFAAICCAFGKYDVVRFHAEWPCAMTWIPKLFGKKCIDTVHEEIDIMALSEIYACDYGVFA